MGNCHQCKHLQYEASEWTENTMSFQGGFYCDGRDTSNPRVERELLRKLDDPAYRKRAKRCFEPVGAQTNQEGK
jgi:hypothetical protein